MNVSRRAFLSRGSLGLAVAGALAVVPGMTTILRLPATRSLRGGLPITGEPLVAHLRDLNSGEISLLAGTNKLIVRDVDLARRLYAAARMQPSKER
jgi:hypothetical protein